MFEEGEGEENHARGPLRRLGRVRRARVRDDALLSFVSVVIHK